LKATQATSGDQDEIHAKNRSSNAFMRELSTKSWPQSACQRDREA